VTTPPDEGGNGDPAARARYDAEHLTGTGYRSDGRAPVRRRRRFSRHQRTTITKGILLFALTLVLCQLWLFTATLNTYLGGDASVVWPGAIASIVCLALNAGLLRQLHWLEEPAAPVEGGSHP
jgi:hypothetical protein